MPQSPPSEFFVDWVPVKGGWRDAAGRPWKVIVQITYDGTAVRCTGLSIEPQLAAGKLGPALTKDILKQLRLDELAKDAGWRLVGLFRGQSGRRRRTVTDVVTGAKRRVVLEGEPLLGELASRITARMPPPRTSSSARYTEVARVYRNARLEGKPPTKAVQEHFHISRNLAATWVHRARKAGQLGRALEPGKSGESLK